METLIRAAFSGVWSGSALFAIFPFRVSSLQWEWGNELRHPNTKTNKGKQSGPCSLVMAYICSFQWMCSYANLWTTSATSIWKWQNDMRPVQTQLSRPIYLITIYVVRWLNPQHSDVIKRTCLRRTQMRRLGLLWSHRHRSQCLNVRYLCLKVPFVRRTEKTGTIITILCFRHLSESC